MTEVVSRVDQCDMREGLREIPDHPAQDRIVFLRKQPDINRN